MSSWPHVYWNNFWVTWNTFLGVLKHISMATHQPVLVGIFLQRFAPSTIGGWPEIWNGYLRTPFESHSSVSVPCSMHPWLFQMSYKVILTCMLPKLHPWMTKKVLQKHKQQRKMAQQQRTGLSIPSGLLELWSQCTWHHLCIPLPAVSIH